MCDVLVLDDDVLLLEAVVRSLRETGLHVVEAHSSAEALACFDRDEPRLLVTDVDLGELTDGRDVARLARQSTPDLPVIFITGRPERFASTLNDNELVLPKPFRFCELIAVMQQAGMTRRFGLAEPSV